MTISINFVTFVNSFCTCNEQKLVLTMSACKHTKNMKSEKEHYEQVEDVVLSFKSYSRTMQVVLTSRL